MLGYFVPGVRKWAGVSLALPGLLLFLYGYATAVYIAFTEDDFYGWLFLLLPFFAAYYVVSRWDEMRSRLIMVGIGLVLLAVGGKFLEADRAREQAAMPEAAAKARSDQLPDGLLLLEQIHRPATPVGYRRSRVDSQVVIERREYVLEGDRAILGVTGRLVG